MHNAVIPHTTLLSPATVGSCTHRVSLYAGGRRRAARLKPKPESSGSVVTAGLVEASCALNSLGPLVDSSDNSILINDTASSSIEKADFSPRSALLARSDSNSSPKSPMRRLSSVKFQLSAPPAPILVPEPEPQSTEVEESGARQGGQEECKENKIARSYSIDSEHDFGDGDTLSELPALGIAGSIKHRNILGVGDVGMGGSECLDDILNANNSTNNNNYSSGSGMFSSASGKQLIDGYVEDEMDEDGDGGSDDSYSLGSDSSSDYEGDVRQVNSTGDLDQLMLRSISDIGGDDISLRNVGGGKGGGGGKYSRKHSAGNYMMSRTASNASVITTATGASTLPSAAGQNEGIRGYDDGTCRLAAIDTAKLDRLLYRDVLGSAQTLTRPMLAGSTDKPVDKVTAGGKVAKKITAKQLTASLTVALASSLCGEEHFGKKFAVPVQESFTFTTDSRVSNCHCHA